MKNKEIQFAPYDTAEFLRTPQEIEDYLKTVFDIYGSDCRAVIRALGTAARAKTATQGAYQVQSFIRRP